MQSTHQSNTLVVPVEPLETHQRGLLTSTYKEGIKATYGNLKERSLFSLKQRVKTTQQNLMPAVGTILKISVFVIGYLIAYA